MLVVTEWGAESECGVGIPALPLAPADFRTCICDLADFIVHRHVVAGYNLAGVGGRSHRETKKLGGRVLTPWNLYAHFILVVSMF